MPAIDDPFGLAASLPGQMAEMRRQMKDLSVNNTQAASQAVVAATASAASATTASNAATSSANAATTASNAATSSANAATTASNAATAASNAATTASNAATTASNAATASAAAATTASNAATNAMVTAAVGHNSASGYALSTTPQELTRATITVPAGYTQALVFGTASMTVLNQSGTGADAIRGYIDINGVSGAVSGGAIVGVVFTISVTVSFSRLITGLTGGSTFYVRCVYYNEAGNTGSTSARNICNLDATVTFLR